MNELDLGERVVTWTIDPYENGWRWTEYITDKASETVRHNASGKSRATFEEARVDQQRRVQRWMQGWPAAPRGSRPCPCGCGLSQHARRWTDQEHVKGKPFRLRGNENTAF